MATGHFLSFTLIRDLLSRFRLGCTPAVAIPLIAHRVDGGHVLTHHIFEILLGQHAGNPEQLAVGIAEEEDRRRTIHRVPAAQGPPRLRKGGDRHPTGDVDPEGLHAIPEELLEVGLADHRLHLLAPVTPLLVEEEHPGVVARWRHTSPEEEEHHQGGREQAVHGSGSCKGRATRIRVYPSRAVLIRTDPPHSLSRKVRPGRAMGRRRAAARESGEEAGAGRRERGSRRHDAPPQVGHI